jgi:membrane dipeptidase
MLIVDAHLDLAYNACIRGRDVTRPAAEQPPVDNEIATVGLPDLHAGGVGLVCATIFCPPKNYKNRGYTTAEEARALALGQLDWYRAQVEADRMSFVRTWNELPAPSGSWGLLTDGSGATPGATPPSREGLSRAALPFILLMEGADAMRSPADVRDWFDFGLRIVGLSWRKCRVAGGTGHPGPLTDEGRALVRAFDDVGIIHDTSHLADESFWQLMDLATGPVIASHSNCRAIVPGDRQLSDEMIKAIASRDGVIGINFYDEFLLPPSEYKKRKCRLSDVIAHVKHIADLLGTTKHIALGTDLDGGVGRDDIPQELTTAADLPRVAEALSDAGNGDQDVVGIMSKNWLDFFRRALPS